MQHFFCTEQNCEVESQRGVLSSHTIVSFFKNKQRKQSILKMPSRLVLNKTRMYTQRTHTRTHSDLC